MTDAAACLLAICPQRHECGADFPLFVTDPYKKCHGHQCENGKPGEARLSPGNDDQRGEDRAERAARLAADLEQSLC
ncbi:hypothetical protein D3C78_1328170 [compost metagenome]